MWRPMIALIGRIEITLFGDSLSAIRLAPALAGAGLVLLTGAIARELGGSRFAQGLAALCVLLAPGILALDHFLNVNAFEPLCWMGCALSSSASSIPATRSSGSGSDCSPDSVWRPSTPC